MLSWPDRNQQPMSQQSLLVMISQVTWCMSGMPPQLHALPSVRRDARSRSRSASTPQNVANGRFRSRVSVDFVVIFTFFPTISALPLRVQYLDGSASAFLMTSRSTVFPSSTSTKVTA